MNVLSLLTVSGLFAVAGAVARLFARYGFAKLFAGTVLIGAVLQAPSVIEPACAVLVLFVYPRLRTFALGAGLSAILFADRPVLLVSALAVLTYGDGLAELFGRGVGRTALGLGARGKTVEGSGALVFVSTLAVATVLVLIGREPPVSALAMGGVVALFAGLVEAQAPGGIDNIVVPLTTAVILDLVSQPGGIAKLAVGAVLGAAVAAVALWRHWMTVQSGVFLVTGMSAAFAAGSLAAAAPFALFVLLTGPATGEAEPIGRTASRLAPAVVASVLPAQPVLLAVLGTGAAGFYRRPLIVVCACAALASVYAFDDPIAAALVGAAALIGVAVERGLGARAVAVYQCPRCGRLVEEKTHCHEQTEWKRGWSWMDRNRARLISGAAAGMATYALLSLPMSVR